VTASFSEWVDRARPPADAPLIVCECASPTTSDGSRWLWVFHESAAHRLEKQWAGEPARAEIDECVGRLRQRGPVWLGGIDTRHAPPAVCFRLVWTLRPAPCRIYTRRRLVVEVEPASVTTHRCRRRARLAATEASALEGWISPDWTRAGISLAGPGAERREVLRLGNAGLFTQFLLMYDGIDLMVDTSWLDEVVPRMAGTLGLPWRIVDLTETPPRVTGQGGPEPGASEP
jgi:hypothetical protein